MNCAMACRPLPTAPPRTGAGATRAFGNGYCTPTSTFAASAALTFASGTHRPAWWPRTSQWHHVGGLDIEPNGLSLCALRHKLFDLGVFTVEPAEHRVIFSQHAIGGGRGMEGELQFHGRAIHAPQHLDQLPAPEFLAWNTKNVFKMPARRVVLDGASTQAAR